MPRALSIRVSATLLALSATACARAQAPGGGDPERARADYQKFCASCHGREGKGDGVMAQVLNPPPKDFTDTAYMKTRTDEQLYLAIQDGGAAAGLSDKMAPWKHLLTEQQMRDLVALVRKLGEGKK